MDMRHQEVIEHPASIVPTKHVYPVIPGHNGVLTSLGSHKLLTTRELPPLVQGLSGVEVEGHAVSIKV